MPNLISNNTNPVQSVDVLDARTRATAWLSAALPGVDVRPGSVTGDLFVSPVSNLTARLETELRNTLGDVDPHNLQNGIIYDCDFVARYLKNAGVVDRPNAVSSGIIRLTFDRTLFREEAERNGGYVTVPAGTHFLFGENSVFTSANSDGILLTEDPDKVRTSPRPRDTFLLSLVSPTEGVFHLRVTGAMLSPVEAGSAAKFDRPLPGVVGSNALYSFLPGNPEETLREKIERSYATFYSASLSSRSGAVKFVDTFFPEISGTSAVLPGDAEMTRSAASLPFSINCMDVFTRSKYGRSQDTVMVEVPVTSDGVTVRGGAQVSFPDYPQLVYRIAENAGSLIDISHPDTVLPADVDQPYAKLYSAVDRGAPGDIYSLTRSRYEKFYIAYAGPVGSQNLITLGTVTFVRLYITYLSDSSGSIVAETIENENNAPVGISLVSRAFKPVLLKLKISYLRRAATSVNLDVARNEIMARVNTATWPRGFSSGEIVDSMIFAGATGVASVQVLQAKPVQSAASAFFTEGDIYDLVSTESFPTQFDPNEEPEYTEEELNQRRRDTCFLLTTENLLFEEVRI